METALALFVQLVIMGFFLVMASLAVVWALWRGLTPRAVILTGAGTLALLIAVVLLLGRENPKENPVLSFQSYFSTERFEKDWDANSKTMLRMSVPADKLDAFKDQYRRYFYELLPGWIASACLIYGLLAYYLVSFVLSRLSQRVPRPMPFKDWVLPEPLVFGLIAAGAVKVIPAVGRGWDLLSGNALVLFGSLYVLGGFSIVSFLFNKWRLPATLRVLSYLILVQLPLETVGALGVLDIWFDFRKIRTPKPEITA